MKIIHGDAFKVLDEMPSKSIDVIITSPPFKYDEIDGERSPHGYVIDKEYIYFRYRSWFDNLLKKLERVTIDYALIFNSSTQLNDLLSLARLPERTLIWFKPRIQSPYRYEPILVYKMDTARYKINRYIWCDVLPYSPIMRATHQNYRNPLELYCHLIAYLSPEHTKTICDPFVGYGTTKVATELFDRGFIGIDSNKKCVEITKERFETVNEHIRLESDKCKWILRRIENNWKKK